MKNKLALLIILIIIALPVVSAVKEIETITEDVDSVKADMPTKIVIQSEIMHIKQIDFIAKEDLGDIHFKIANMKDRPSTSHEPDYDIYEYFEIIPYKATKEDMKSIEITFFIVEDWLIYRNHDVSDVVLLRFAGRDWEELDTRFVSEHKPLYTFKAETPGFQYFAIAAKKSIEFIEPEVIEEPVVISEPEQQVEKEETINYLLIFIAVVLIILISYFVLGKKKRKRRK